MLNLRRKRYIYNFGYILNLDLLGIQSELHSLEISLANDFQLKSAEICRDTAIAKKVGHLKNACKF
jgi:hypothetical protein